MSVGSCGLFASSPPATVVHREAPQVCGEIEELTDEDYRHLDNVANARKVIEGAAMPHLADSISWIEHQHEGLRFNLWVCRAALGDERAKQIVAGGPIVQRR